MNNIFDLYREKIAIDVFITPLNNIAVRYKFRTNTGTVKAQEVDPRLKNIQLQFYKLIKKAIDSGEISLPSENETQGESK